MSVFGEICEYPACLCLVRRLTLEQGVIRASNFAGSLYAETADAAALEMEAAMALAASEAARYAPSPVPCICVCVVALDR